MSDPTLAPAQAHAEPTTSGLRFEKQELESFVADDTFAGRAIGQLLAFLFMVLLFLMVSATVWTVLHQNASDDPHTVGSPETSSGH